MIISVVSEAVDSLVVAVKKVEVGSQNAGCRPHLNHLQFSIFESEKTRKYSNFPAIYIPEYTEENLPGGSM